MFRTLIVALLLIATTTAFGQTPIYQTEFGGSLIGAVKGVMVNSQIVRTSSSAGVREFQNTSGYPFTGTPYSGSAVNSNIVGGVSYFVTGSEVLTAAPVTYLPKPSPSATTHDIVTAGGYFYVSYPSSNGSNAGTIGIFQSNGTLIRYDSTAGSYTLTHPTFMSHKPSSSINAIVDDGLGVLLVDNDMNQVGAGFLPISGVKCVCWYGDYLIVSVANELRCINPDNGNVLWTFSSLGSCSFSSPMGLTWVGNKLFVADSGNQRVVIFSLDPALPLPVELVSFSATATPKVVQLDWHTASEQNNKGFEVERSEDGIVFNKIGFVAGAGNSAITHNYQFVDRNPANGTAYYRLRQVDFDGSFAYSKIVSVTIRGGKLAITIYPNPAADFVRVSGIKEGDLVTIANSFGQIVRQETATGDIVNLNTAALPAGFYVVHANNVEAVKLQIVH